MKFKRMLKFALCVALLSASASAWAQNSTEPEVVTLDGGNGKKVTWSNFVDVINGKVTPTGTVSEESQVYTDLQAAKKAYYGEGQDEDGNDYSETNPAPGSKLYILNEKEEAYNAAYDNYHTDNDSLTMWNGQIAALPSTLVNPTWLTDSKTNGLNFYQQYEAADFGDPYDENVYIYYRLKANAAKTKFQLFVSFINPGDVATGEWTSESSENTWYKANAGGYISVIGEKTISSLNIYFGKDKDGNYNYTAGSNGNYSVTSFNSSNIIGSAVDKIQTLEEGGSLKYDPCAAYRAAQQAKVNALTTISADGKTKLAYEKGLMDAAQKEYNTAKTNADTAKTTLTTAQNAYDQAVKDAAANARTDYDNVTLTADITATTAITKTYNGTIDAQGNVITVGVATLFGTYFKGHLTNAIINGNFATGTSATNFSNVAIWRGTSGTYYNEDESIGNKTDIGLLGYLERNRQFFGVDLTNKKLVKWSDASQVYFISAYQPNVATPKTFYTNIASDGSKYKFLQSAPNASELNANTLYGSDDKFEFGGKEVSVPNVIINNECADLVITDKVSFYCPSDITATKVTLGRELKAGYNTVCLPFPLLNSDFGTDGLVCTYDKETTDKFWFNKVAAETLVPANTPVLVYLKANKTLELSSVSVAATPATQMINYEGATDDASEAVGFFKNVTADDIRGASNAYKVYGLQNSGSTLDDAKFAPAATATFGACRMVIKSENTPKSGAPLMARGIAIVDEKGIEINVGEWSGVEFVDMEAASLDIKAGQGEIIITTDANYGMQNVYSLDGKTVATVNVVEGINTVSVQSGVYVVMGEKVLVK